MTSEAVRNSGRRVARGRWRGYAVSVTTSGGRMQNQDKAGRASG